MRLFGLELSPLALLRRYEDAEQSATIAPKGDARRKLEAAGYRVVVYPPSLTMRRDWQGTLLVGDLAIATASGDDEEGMYQALLLAVKG